MNGRSQAACEQVCQPGALAGGGGSRSRHFGARLWHGRSPQRSWILGGLEGAVLLDPHEAALCSVTVRSMYMWAHLSGMAAPCSNPGFWEDCKVRYFWTHVQPPGLCDVSAVHACDCSVYPLDDSCGC